ncbi:hypothetical protein PHYPSEUDO_001293 [Phytophthora pseudosyringae]|uniref:Uncharacterized protein n=1 Tax=Phytophthora pseudosyringae TaxID=221518 RepID=A0A8T1VZ22_9STRA|nr:hypothetical protein PHYPSEUDO_001293 [Phytophthora pseudosyringae]
MLQLLCQLMFGTEPSRPPNVKCGEQDQTSDCAPMPVDISPLPATCSVARGFAWSVCFPCAGSEASERSGRVKWTELGKRVFQRKEDNLQPHMKVDHQVAHVAPPAENGQHDFVQSPVATRHANVWFIWRFVIADHAPAPHTSLRVTKATPPIEPTAIHRIKSVSKTSEVAAR